MFKKLMIGAALSVSSLAMANPPLPPSMVRGGGQVHEVRGDAFDVAEGRRLLRELDSMGGRRDTRFLDARIVRFMEAELAESRMERRGNMDRRERREEKMSTKQLTRLLNDFRRVENRFGFRAQNEKRRILVEAVNIAERDLRDARDDRFSRR